MRFRRFLIVWILTLFHPDLEFGAESPYATLAAKAILESAPFVSAWNPAGSKLAFTLDGIVQTVDLASGKKLPLTKIDPSSQNCPLSWSPSGTSLLLACSNSLTEIDTISGHSKRLLSSKPPLTDAQFSSDGASITFIREHNLFQMPATGGTAKQLTTAGNENLLIAEPDPLYAQEFRLPRAYWWSPDSSAIAYLETDRTASGTYSQAGKDLPLIKLKLLNVTTGKVSEVVAGTTDRPYISGVAWLPDAQRITYQLLNRLQNQFDLNVYDFAAASSRPIFSEKDPYWINLPGPPVFIGNGEKFLITSERTGYRHIYLYDIAGQMQADLTPGKVEVTGPVTLDSSKQAAYFNALADNLHDLHLYRVALDGAPPRQITKEPGWHEIRLSPGQHAFLDKVSTSDTPPSICIRGIDGAEIAALALHQTVSVPKAEFPEIRTHDKVLLPAMMWRPADFDPLKKYPLILYTFSGPPGHVVKNAWDGWQNAWNRSMTSKGFIVAAVDVRGSGGYGHFFEEYIHYRFGAQETADLREVFNYFSRLTYIDAKRVGIWGCDYGAHITVHAMLEFPNGFAAGFADSPITDWTTSNSFFTERYLGLPAKRITEYDDSSPLENAKRISGKLLVASSPANTTIRNDQTSALQKALGEAKKPLETLLFPNANYHDDVASLAKLMTRMADFFTTNL